MRIYSQGPDKVEINPEIISSDIYRRFIEIAHKGEMVVDSSPLWDELERMVLRYSPNFKKNLYLLASGNLSGRISTLPFLSNAASGRPT